jgi:hypothetical protein
VFDSVTLQLRGRTAEGQGTVNRLRMNDPHSDRSAAALG